MELLSGYIEHITYRNEENGYTVLQLAAEGEDITCVGVFALISEGECVELEGEYTIHPSYGAQLQVSSYRIQEPKDALSMERYLASGAIKGIGAALAGRIVRRFREDTFRIMEEEPERLAEVKGISQRKAMEIAEQVMAKKELRRAMMYLQRYGISLSLAMKIHETYGMDMYRILQENPYRLAEDIDGIGFKIADEIARHIGIRTDSDFRIRSGILYLLLTATQEGHTYLPAPELTRRACLLLGVPAEAIEKHYMDMTIDRKLMLKEVEEELQVYAAAYFYMEANAAVMLQRLNVTYDISEPLLARRIAALEEESKLKLDELQLKAVREAVKNGLLVITGGPGTGKTTTINTILRYFESEGIDLCLAAPTGRAAKRMSEATGFEAKTIHRLLEVSGGLEGKGGFERNEHNPLETDVIIVDEASMVDISLLHALLKAIVPGTRLILVGDVNQLPSVGPGRVLQDLISSRLCSVVRLNRIFRQASQSDIIVNAHKINAGEDIVLDNKSRDFFFLQRSDANVIISICIPLVREKMPQYVDATPLQIQVLTPTRKGLLGVERLNRILQEYLNPPSREKEEWTRGESTLRVGDKVMQIKNNYQTEWEVLNRYGIPIEKGCGVFNGDMGLVEEIDHFSETLTVIFDEGRRVTYSFKQLEELELAYAITIHKSQGSEYPAVVIPLLNGPKMLMNRNLIYTAVTRAQKCVTLVGDANTFAQMVQNGHEQTRYSGLKARLEELQ